MKVIYCIKCSRPTDHEMIFDPWEVDEAEAIPRVILKEVRERIPDFDIAETTVNKAFETPEKLYVCLQCGDYRWDD